MPPDLSGGGCHRLLPINKALRIGSVEEALDTLPPAELNELEPPISPKDLLAEEAEPEEELKPEAPPPRLNEVRQYLAEIGAYRSVTHHHLFHPSTGR